MGKRAWNLMRAGQTEEAIRLLEGAYARDKNHSRVMELGVAYLWTANYRAARRHFRTAIAEQPIVADMFHAMAGTASWCLRDHENAVTQWRNGLSCGYTDAGGGITLPLLLFFASVVSTDLLSQEESRELLSRRLRSSYAGNWPGPLAEFVLGRIDDAEAIRRYPRQDESDEIISRWRTSFYAGVLKFDKGNAMRYKEVMRLTAAVADDDFDSKSDHFLRKLRHNEFYIARHESRVRRREWKGSEG